MLWCPRGCAVAVARCSGQRGGQMGDSEGLVFQKPKIPNAAMMPPVAFQASDGQLAGSGPRMVLMGGQRRGISGEMWILETNGDGYMQVQPDVAKGSTTTIPERTQCSLVSLGAEPQNLTLVFGGYVLNVGEANDVWQSEHSLDENTSMPVAVHTKITPDGTPPAPRYGHTATLVGDSMIVVGGQNSKEQFNDVWSLSTAEPWVWTSIATDGPGPSPRSRHTATLAGDEILVMGGFSRADRVVGDAFMLKVSGGSGSWRAWEPAQGALPPPRAQHTATPHPDGKHIYVLGGCAPGGALTSGETRHTAARRALHLIRFLRARARCASSRPTPHVLLTDDGEKNHKDLWIINVPDSASAEVKCTVQVRWKSRQQGGRDGERA